MNGKSGRRLIGKEICNKLRNHRHVLGGARELKANIEKNSFLQKSLNNRQYNVNRQRREIIRIQVPINRWILTDSSPIHREKVATSSPITRGQFPAN